MGRLSSNPVARPNLEGLEGISGGRRSGVTPAILGSLSRCELPICRELGHEVCVTHPKARTNIERFES